MTDTAEAESAWGAPDREPGPESVPESAAAPMAALAVPALAMVGALAVACFTTLFKASFTAKNRLRRMASSKGMAGRSGSTSNRERIPVLKKIWAYLQT